MGPEQAMLPAAGVAVTVTVGLGEPMAQITRSPQVPD
jgi:hypothetical protein